jgi:hypothetical protein
MKSSTRKENEMQVTESDAYSGHYPHWAFQLGGERYQTKGWLPTMLPGLPIVLPQIPF